MLLCLFFIILSRLAVYSTRLGTIPELAERTERGTAKLGAGGVLALEGKK